MKRPQVTVKKSSKVDLQPNRIQTTQSKAVIETTNKVSYCIIKFQSYSCVLQHVQQQQQQRLTMHLAKIEITRDDLTVKVHNHNYDIMVTILPAG